jgi:hypothetical protein
MTSGLGLKTRRIKPVVYENIISDTQWQLSKVYESQKESTDDKCKALKCKESYFNVFDKRNTLAFIFFW